MTNEANQGPSGLIDENSTTVRARNGATLTLTRAVPNVGNILTVRPRDGRQGAELSAMLTDDDLRALLVSREKNCASCVHARAGSLGGTRCHERLRANRHGVYAPLIAEPKKHVCGKFEQLIKPAARQVAA